jgi:hypothetical protein
LAIGLCLRRNPRSSSRPADDAVRRLRHRLPNNQLEDGLDRDPRFVALHQSIRTLLNPGLGIGKVVLRLLARLGFLRILPRALGLLPCTLLQRTLGFSDPGDPGLPPLQLFRQLVPPEIPAVAAILFFIRRLGLAQQPPHFLPQPLGQCWR